MPSFSVILPAAGQSSRFHDQHYKKPFAPLEQRAVWLHSAERFLNRKDVKQVVVVVSPEDHEEFMSKFGANVMILGVDVVLGGKERADSVFNALEKVSDECAYVAVHDAARPCIADEWIDRVFEAAVQHGAAILGNPVTATLKRVASDQTIEATIPRDRLWEAQTPQVFRKDLLLKAYAMRGKMVATDEASLVEQIGHKVKIVPGSPLNIKITTKEDLRLASYLLKALPKPKGLGPVHPFADDDLWR